MYIKYLAQRMAYTQYSMNGLLCSNVILYKDTRKAGLIDPKTNPSRKIMVLTQDNICEQNYLGNNTKIAATFSKPGKAEREVDLQPGSTI